MYFKQFYIYNHHIPMKAIIRNYTKADFPELIRIQRECFPPPFPEELLWNVEQLNNHVTIFTQGALCIEINGQLVGSMTALMTKFNPLHTAHSWAEMTDDGYIRTHNPNGNALYVVDISVSPNFRKLGIGKWLMQSMYELVIQLGLERLVGGSRMPGYYKYAGSMSAKQYVEAIVNGQMYDPVISFLLRCGRTPLAVVENYLEDAESCNYGMLMEWQNPFLAKTIQEATHHGL